MSARQIAQVVIRVVAILLCIYACMLIVPVILFQIPYSWSTFWERPFYNLRDELVIAIPLLAIAVALWVFQARLARLIVPRFPRCCEECGYSLKNLKADRCPECGTEVRGRGEQVNR